MNLDEREIFETYKLNYELVNPPPNLPVRADWRSLGFIFVLKLITGLASVGLVALRTAGEFYRAAEIAFGNVWFARSEAVLALLGIEGSMFVLGAVMAERKGGKTNDLFAWSTIVLTLIISLVAGFAHSLGVIESLPPDIYNIIMIILTVIMTLASIVAYFSGELIGGDIVRLDIEYKRNLKRYEADLDSWRASLANSWRASAERKLARRDLKYAMESYEPEIEEVSESYRKFQKPGKWDNPHWRNLPKTERRRVAGMEVGEIMDEYNVSERTAYNWIEYTQNMNGNGD